MTVFSAFRMKYVSMRDKNYENSKNYDHTKRERRTKSLISLLQRITSNLCLGPSLPTTLSSIGSGLIWMSIIQQAAISLAPLTTMADSSVSVFVYEIHQQKAASAQQVNCPVVLVHSCQGWSCCRHFKQD